MEKRTLDAYSQEFKDLLYKTKALEVLQAVLYMLYLFGLPPKYQNEMLRNPVNSLEDMHKYAKNYDNTLAVLRGGQMGETPLTVPLHSSQGEPLQELQVSPKTQLGRSTKIRSKRLDNEEVVL